MDTEPEHARREEVERLPDDDIDSKMDTPGGHGVGDTDFARQTSDTSTGLEKRQDFDIVDWDGPNDPENPYASFNVRSKDW